MAQLADDDSVKTQTSSDSETIQPRRPIIAALSKIGFPIRRNRIAAETGLKGNHAYRIFKKLIAEGEVGFDKDPEDKRAFRYFLKDPRT